MKRFIYSLLLSSSLTLSPLSYGVTSGPLVTNMSLSDSPLFLGGMVAPNIMLTFDDSASMDDDVIWQNTRSTDDGIVEKQKQSFTFNSLYYDPDIDYQPWSDSSEGDASWDEVIGSEVDGIYYNFNKKKDPNTIGAVNNKKNYKIKKITSSKKGKLSKEQQNYANWKKYHSTKIKVAKAGVGQAFATQGGELRVGFAKTSLSSDSGTSGYYGGTKIDGQSGTYALVSGVRTFTGSNRETFFKLLYGSDAAGYSSEHTPLRQTLSDVETYFKRTDNSGPWGADPGSDDTSAHLSCRKNINILVTDGEWNGSGSSVILENYDGKTLTHHTYTPNSDSYQYKPEYPFKDLHLATLADQVIKTWDTDLRTDLSDNVPQTTTDPAFWQHLTTMTIGLGSLGTLNPSVDSGLLESGGKVWPDPTTIDPSVGIDDYELSLQHKRDDLWHAGINGRGGYFSSATTPVDLAEQIKSVLSSNIDDNYASNTSLAFNSSDSSKVSRIYRASFNPDSWSGQLEAHAIEQQVTSKGLRLVLTGLDWKANLPLYDSRRIVTYKRTGTTSSSSYEAMPFRWKNLTDFQKARLEENEDHLNYLRGDWTHEQHNGGEFRDRETILGDIIHSSPVYVGESQQNFPDIWDKDGSADAAENSKAYSTFKSVNIARQGIVYVGANDGMLHAFNADTGAEVFAYIPNSVIKERLVNLTKPDYNHKYYVDGDIVVSDAFFDGKWHTVLVSGLGGGGQGIFAIDITSVPSLSDSETEIAQKILWEFHDNFDARDNGGGENGRSDLGYTYGKPSIVRLNSGKWAVVFSGGYNNTVNDDYYDSNPDVGRFDSDTGNAVLYIVDIETGKLIKKFDTQTGFLNDPDVEDGSGRPNGLASPTLVDLNGDFKVDFIYAGDLFGNIWKVDISDDDEISNWGFSAGSPPSASPTPIYTACASATCAQGKSNNHQPITTEIQVVRHPAKGGQLLLFGTGKYLETGDTETIDQITQSFYAIEDLNKPQTLNRDSLLKQEIIQELTEFNSDLRITSQNMIDWSTQHGWYIDLLLSTGSDNKGERQITDAFVRNNRVLFNSFIPSNDPCMSGGENWTMILNIYSGARFNTSPFDLDGDGIFTKDESIAFGAESVATSGKKTESGIITPPTIFDGGSGEVTSLDNDNDSTPLNLGDGDGSGSEVGRQSWRQLTY